MPGFGRRLVPIHGLAAIRANPLSKVVASSDMELRAYMALLCGRTPEANRPRPIPSPGVPTKRRSISQSKLSTSIAALGPFQQNSRCFHVFPACLAVDVLRVLQHLLSLAAPKLQARVCSNPVRAPGNESRRLRPQSAYERGGLLACLGGSAGARARGDRAAAAGARRGVTRNAAELAKLVLQFGG